jgi:phage terminase large subunit-like protein
MVVIGTLKHHDDLYAHLKGHPSWEVIQEPAIITWPKSFHIVMGTDRNGREVVKGVDIEGESKVLWPEKRPIDYLLKERHAITPRQFAREFQHQVQDDETAQIKREWIDKALERGRSFSLYEVPPLELDIVQGWDLALVTDQKRAEQADTDYTVGVTWARAKNGDRYFLGIYRNRGLTPGQLQGAVKAEYARVPRRPRVVVVERNNFGELHFLGLQQSTDLPLKAHITGRGKSDAWEGVPALASLFENGKVILPSKTQRDREALEPFIAELYGLGKERHDDTVMALWIAECNVRKGGFEHQIAFDDEDIKLPEEDDRLPSQPKIIQMRERKRAAWTVWESLPRDVADVIELPEE